MDDGQAVGVVKHLLQQSRLLNKGFHLFTDNFYTKPVLADYLYDNGTLLTGTIRSNSKGLPKDIGKLQVSVGECKAYRDDKKLVIAFQDKKTQRKPVLALSTAHSAKMVTKTIRNKVKTKPEMIMDYNLKMGGVDISDKKSLSLRGGKVDQMILEENFFQFRGHITAQFFHHFLHVSGHQTYDYEQKKIHNFCPRKYVLGQAGGEKSAINSWKCSDS